ncbi:thiamine pyrophosphate-binding protein [Alphaproteobacteria bacterium]|jgi:acetolactate synthase I/II/III large subunit|nr:thiamine pyrophosphate-binding protein [Alphaproteobacteria bacterium]
MQRHGGQILVDQLAIQGCDRVFCVPGESYLAALDGLYAHNAIHTVVCRQEGGAAMMAEAYGKATGAPGICFCTRGPGATNAAAGVHVAFQDSTPMILFIGQVASDQKDREAFQEVNYELMFAPLAKWVAQIDSVDRIPEYISQAYHRAMSGRPGPVVLALPEDMLSSSADVLDAKAATSVEAKLADEDLQQLKDLLVKAERPLMIVGGSGWSQTINDQLEAFAAREGMPVACAFRFQDHFDNTHPNYVGDVGIGVNPKLVKQIADSDLLIAIGIRMGEMTTSGYTLLDIPSPKQKLVHVYPGSDELGRVYRPHLAINASSRSFVLNLTDLTGIGKSSWREQSDAGHADYEANIVPEATAGDFRVEEAVTWLSDNLPIDTVVTNGAGNYSAWVHRYHQYRKFGSQLAPTSGSMGYGLPAAIGGQFAHPDRRVVCFAGDGCLMMTCQELATIAAHDLPIIVVVVNNGMYGTIRMHQERTYPGRVSGTSLHNPDFVAFARSFGLEAALVEHTEDFATAFEAALASNKPYLLELKVDPEALSPKLKLSSLTK